MEKLCRNCIHWNKLPEKEDVGDCFGHQVPGSFDSGKCPTNSFQPRQ